MPTIYRGMVVRRLLVVSTVLACALFFLPTAAFAEDVAAEGATSASRTRVAAIRARTANSATSSQSATKARAGVLSKTGSGVRVPLESAAPLLYARVNHEHDEYLKRNELETKFGEMVSQRGLIGNTFGPKMPIDPTDLMVKNDSGGNVEWMWNKESINGLEEGKRYEIEFLIELALNPTEPFVYNGVMYKVKNYENEAYPCALLRNDVGELNMKQFKCTVPRTLSSNAGIGIGAELSDEEVKGLTVKVWPISYRQVFTPGEQ